MRIFIDTSLFLEYILPSEGYGRTDSEKEFRRTVEDARGNDTLDLVTSHVVLGEVLQVLHSTSEEGWEQKILFDFRKVFDLDTYRLSSSEPRELRGHLGRVLDCDPRLSHNDAVILAQAIGEEVDSVKATDKDWSRHLEELGVQLDIL